jgi:hypothetical protein
MVDCDLEAHPESSERCQRCARRSLRERLGKTEAVAIAVLAALACVGCAGGPTPGDRRAAKATVRTFLTALADGDGARACGVLTPAARATLTVAAGAARAPCPSAIAAASRRLPGDVRAALGDVRVVAVAIRGDRATVTDDAIRSPRGDLRPVLRRGDVTRLVKVGGVWRIAG